MEKHQEEIDRLEQEYAALREEYAPRLEALDKEVRERYRQVSDDLRTARDELDVDDYPVPEPDEADEDGDDPLYDSSRDYFDQLAYYKRFQQKRSTWGGEP